MFELATKKWGSVFPHTFLFETESTQYFSAKTETEKMIVVRNRRQKIIVANVCLVAFSNAEVILDLIPEMTQILLIK